MLKSSFFSHDKVVQHQGIFYKQIGLFQAVALIVSGTIGAGVLGIPYAVAQVGLFPGVLYIVGLGILMLGLNLLLAEAVMAAKHRFQIAGLAGKYLGRPAKVLMTIIFYTISFGALVVYLIGEGQVLSALFGGAPIWWSIFFFSICAFLIFLGVQAIKSVEFFLTLGILIVIILIALWSTPHVQWVNWQGVDLAKILFPYGIILFAFHGTGTIPQAYTLLSDHRLFQKAILISAFVCITFYLIFTIAVVGVTGTATTEIATIGLGKVVGPIMLLFGNIFAALAMGTSYLMVGLSLRDSLSWDYKLSQATSFLLVSIVPLAIFLGGIRGFTQAIDLIGGVFISLELLLIVWIYLRVDKILQASRPRHGFRPLLLLVAFLLLAFSFGGVYSVLKLF